MLIDFSVENFLSFKDLSKLSMIAVKSFKEHLDTNTILLDKKIRLVKSAVLYGNNASGKSNLLVAMGFMKKTVINSFRDALVENTDKKFHIQKFALNTASEKDSSFFEISFIQNNVKYRYGFEVDYNKVVSEWLYHTTSKEVPLFKRNLQSFEINKSAFKEGVGKDTNTKENVLFLTLVAQLNGTISNEVITWFKNYNIINGIFDEFHKEYTISKLKSDKNFNAWAQRFIKYLEISNIETTEEELGEINIDKLKTESTDEEFVSLVNTLQKIKSKQPRKDELLTFHRKYDENNLLVDTVPFKFEKQESEGTKKLLYLLGPWFDTLQNGKILIVDELDSRLHTSLTSKLIDFFHRYNKNNAQLIFAVHDIYLLNKDTFRRDQIWFVEKNQFGASELFSLADFKSESVRSKSSFNKNYATGKYGAVPYFEFDEKLNQLMYGKE